MRSFFFSLVFCYSQIRIFLSQIAAFILRETLWRKISKKALIRHHTLRTYITRHKSALAWRLFSLMLENTHITSSYVHFWLKIWWEWIAKKNFRDFFLALVWNVTPINVSNFFFWLNHFYYKSWPCCSWNKCWKHTYIFHTIIHKPTQKCRCTVGLVIHISDLILIML